VALAAMSAGCGPKRRAGAARARTWTAPQAAEVAATLVRYPDRSKHDLSADRGNVVLLDVWATWCEPCKDSLPVYQRLAEQYASRGLRVYAINVDEDVRQVEPFLAETGVKIPVLLDTGAQFAESVLRVSVMPSSFLLDRRGEIRHVHEGFSPGLEETVRREIDALLAE
jgi:thiol-disulfide isomerase/thioredoxin